MIRFLMIIFICSFVMPVRAKNKAVPIDSLRWLSGCWRYLTEGSEQEEQWMKPLNRLMVCISRSTDTGMGASFEFLRIVQDPKGINL